MDVLIDVNRKFIKEMKGSSLINLIREYIDEHDIFRKRKEINEEYDGKYNAQNYHIKKLRIVYYNYRKFLMGYSIYKFSGMRGVVKLPRWYWEYKPWLL